MSAPYAVGIVVDPHFGDRADSLASEMHVWIVDSPVNSSAANRIWSAAGTHGLESGVTTFKVSDPGDRQGNVIGVLDAVELHHCALSHKPPVSVCHVFGVSVTPALRRAFEELGYTLSESTEEGFLQRDDVLRNFDSAELRPMGVSSLISVGDESRMRSSICFAFILLRCLAFAEEPPCPGMYLDRNSVLRLANAGSIAELRTAWSAISAPDPAQKIVYADRLVHLLPSAESDDLLITAIPSNELDYEFVYYLGDVDQGHLDGPLHTLGTGGWLSDATTAILRRHHGMAAFLTLSIFHNDDFGEMLPDFNDDLRRKAPREFAKAMKSLPKEVRDAELGGFELLPAE